MFSMKQNSSTNRILSVCCILFLLQINTKNFCFLSFVESTINSNVTILIYGKNSSSDISEICGEMNDDNVIENSGENRFYYPRYGYVLLQLDAADLVCLKPTNKPGITNQNQKLNTSFSSPVIHNTKMLMLCGTLPFCDNSANSACMNTTIKNCNKCNLVKGVLFMLFLIILGVVILIGNMLIIAVVIRCHRKKKIDKIDMMKTSLAVADLLTGKYHLLNKFKNLLKTIKKN